MRIQDVSYLIGHTATPAQPIPPNIALVAELLGYDGPYVEIRQACTGFANALVMTQGLLSAAGAAPVAIVGSETGSVFFDPLRALESHGQKVNLVQMGDGAGAIVLGPEDARPGARLSRTFFGQIGRQRPSGLKMSYGGSDAPSSPMAVLEFNHDFPAIREFGLDLFTHGMKAARALDIDPHDVDWVIPHQANGRMAELFAPNINAEQVFVNADRIGNTGSAAIWLALADLRERMKEGQRALILGAEATKYMFGGFLYVHG
jgi:3-oxoacyl-[acyl-carrier-protein] synthase-3